MSKPLVSIAIPAYNRPRLIKKTIESVLGQLYSNIEVLISEDCTPNIEVVEVIEGFAAVDERIRFFRQEKNLGYEKNCDFLLKKAKGEYILWLPDDDLLLPDTIQEFVSAMQANKNAILCISDVQVVDQNGQPLRAERLSGLYDDCLWNEKRKLFFAYPTSNIFFAYCGMYRTDIFDTYNIEQEPDCNGLYTNLEVPYLARLSLIGEIIAVPETLFLYRSHEDSTYIKEIAKMSRWDGFRLRLCVRSRLFLIAMKASIPFSERMVLLRVVLVTLLKSQSHKLFGLVARILPYRLKNYIKAIIKSSK